MGPSSIVERAFAAFAPDLASPPPLSLRGGSDVDSYRRAVPFDPVEDEPTDEYLERYASWGLIYLDAQSWRHYVPHVIAYAMRHTADRHMVVEGFIRTLRPPDQYPPRLATLTPEQEAVVTAFLEGLLVDPAWGHVHQDVQQALEEWWWPEPSSRPTAADIIALRTAPTTYRSVGEANCRLDLPQTLAGGGLHDIPEESRRVEVWGGYLCGDAHTVVAINVTPLSLRSLEESIAVRQSLFREPATPRALRVPGAADAVRLDGQTHGDSPAEPQALTIVLAATPTELVTLSIRTWPREDLAREVEKIVSSLRLVRD